MTSGLFGDLARIQAGLRRNCVVGSTLIGMRATLASAFRGLGDGVVSFLSIICQLVGRLAAGVTDSIVLQVTCQLQRQAVRNLGKIAGSAQIG